MVRQLRAECCGETQIETVSESGDKVKIILNDVRYVPGLPQRMFSTGKLCRSGGEFLQSARGQSVIVMPNTEKKRPINKKRGIYMVSPP